MQTINNFSLTVKIKLNKYLSYIVHGDQISIKQTQSM